jgi:hypothetical protein
VLTCRRASPAASFPPCPPPPRRTLLTRPLQANGIMLVSELAFQIRTHRSAWISVVHVGVRRRENRLGERTSIPASS